MGMSTSKPSDLDDGCKGAPVVPGARLPLVGDESLMRDKAHGTCATPVKADVRWGCDAKLADRICCFNRHYAEHSGYFLTTSYLKEVSRTEETTYYDSVTGRPLFIAPRGRTFAEFEKESRAHGWPSFRDAEVVWDDVRVLPDGETVSTAGTHLGHNLPDRKGNRYCINLVSVCAQKA
jgi:peptide methionine sulfoxide reductase MsrB